MSGLYCATKVFNPGKGYPCVFRNWREKHSHCRLWHGYDLMFQVTLASEDKDIGEQGWVYDFGNFDLLKKEIDHNFDHTWIIAEDDPMREQTEAYIWACKQAKQEVADIRIFPASNVSGCEAFAAWLARSAADMLYANSRLGPVRVLEARVFEHMGNSASYRPGVT